MKKKVIIITLISILMIISIVGIIVYQNANRELLMGYYYNYDDVESHLEIKEDGTFYFDVRVYISWALEGTYKVDDKYLILYPTDNEEIKFEIQNKKIKVIDGGVFDDIVKEGMKYKWSEEEK